MMAMEGVELAEQADRRVRVMSGGFGIEIVVAFPVLGDRLGEPIIAAAGQRDRVGVRPAQVFRYAIKQSASAIVLGHNHPEGGGPSEADRAVTRRLVAAGTILGIPLLAHVVAEPDAVHDLVSGRSWARGDARDARDGLAAWPGRSHREHSDTPPR